MSLRNNITEATQAEMGVPHDADLMIRAPLPCQRWSEKDCTALGVSVTPQFIVEQGYLLKRQFIDGELDSLKGYIPILPKEILDHPDYASLRAQYHNQPIDARVGALVAKIYSGNKSPSVAGAKVIHSNPFNRDLDIPRQSSEIVVKDLIAGTTLGIVEGTSISNSRTAFYSVLVWDAFFHNKQKVNVVIVGSGAVAKEITAILNHHAKDQIASVVVCSPRGSQAFVADMKTKVQVPLRAINDLNATTDLKEADLVVTVTSNSKEDGPVIVSKDMMKPNVVMLSLGTDEQPVDFLEQVLQRGVTVCDTVENVSNRNAQALALYFSRKGQTLKEEAVKYGVREIFHLDGGVRSEDQPVLVACSGLAVMDIWYAYRYLGVIARAAGYDPLF